MSNEQFTIKTFKYEIKKLNKVYQLRYDVQIPLPEYVNGHEIFSHFATQQNIPFFLYEGLKIFFNNKI